MRQSARQILRLFMVAVLLSAGGLNAHAAAMAAFDAHEHGHHGLHDHAADHQHGAGLDADPCGSQGCDDEPASTGKPCAHLHGHCCTAYAVPAADCILKLAHDARAAVPAAVSHIPHGQLSSPLFRPPRAIA